MAAGLICKRVAAPPLTQGGKRDDKSLAVEAKVLPLSPGACWAAGRKRALQAGKSARWAISASPGGGGRRLDSVVVCVGHQHSAKIFAPNRNRFTVGLA